MHPDPHGRLESPPEGVQGRLGWEWLAHDPCPALARRQPPARPTCAAARRAICRFLASGPPAGQAKKSRVTSRARAPQVYLDVARCPWRACDARGERARLEPANGLACAALSSGSRSCSSQPRSFCRSQSRIIHSRSHSRNSSVPYGSSPLTTTSELRRLLGDSVRHHSSQED